MPDISIIVPVYNVDRYLSTCIDSILAQSHTDWELILVDDGSKDNSGKICDEYSRHDKRIKVLHLENGGPSNARNEGIRASNGTYLCFIDSDDWAEEKYLEHLYEGIHEGVGLVVAGHKYQNRDNTKQYVIRQVGQNFHEGCDINTFYDQKNMHEILPSLMSFGFPHGKLYNAKVIKENNIEFPREVRFCEDVIFMLRYLIYVEWTSFVREADNHYMYSNNEVSLIQKFNDPESEYACYRISKSGYESLYRKYSLTDKEMLPSKEWTAFLLWRCIRTLYVDGQRKLSRKESLRFLKTLKDEDIKLLMTYKAWIRKKNMGPIRMLQKHHYIVADLWLYNVARIGELWMRIH